MESEQIIAGAWRGRDGKETVIIAVNIADESAEFSLEFNLAEYGIEKETLPDCFTSEGSRCTVCDSLESNSIRVYKIPTL